MYSSTSASAETLPAIKIRNPIDCDKCDDDNFRLVLNPFYFKPKMEVFRKAALECSGNESSNSKRAKKSYKKCLNSEEAKINPCQSLTQIFDSLKIKEQSFFLNNEAFDKLEKPWYESNQKCLESVKKQTSRFFCYPKIMVSVSGSYITYYRLFRKYILEGASSFCMNISYGSLKRHKKIKEHIAAAMYNTIECSTSLGVEITSRQLRTGQTRNNETVVIEKDSTIYLTTDRRFSTLCSHKAIYINFADYLKKIESDDLIIIGEVLHVIVCKVYPKSLVCKVLNEALLSSNMSVRLPVIRSFLPYEDLTQEEICDVDEVISLNCNFIILPCFKAIQLVNYIRGRHGTGFMEIFAKIVDGKELSDSNVELITSNFDGVYFCSGNTYNNDNLIQKCMSRHLKIIWAHNNSLQTISSQQDPRMAKRMCLFSDVVCVNPDIISPQNMRTDIKVLCYDLNQQNFKLSSIFLMKVPYQPETDIVKNVVFNLLKTNSTCIIIINDNGIICKQLANLRPHVQIVATFICEEVASKMTTVRNIRPLIYDVSNNCSEDIPSTWKRELQSRLELSVHYASEMKFINKLEPFIFLFPSERDLSYCDFYKILQYDVPLKF